MLGRLLVVLSSLALLHSAYAAWHGQLTFLPTWADHDEGNCRRVLTIVCEPTRAARVDAKIAGIHLDRRMGTAVPTEVRSFPG